MSTTSSPTDTTPPTYSPEYLAQYCGYNLVNVAIAFTVLEIIFVALRFSARYVGSVKFAFDDVLVVIALIMCVAINAVAIAMVQFSGVGYHEVLVYHENPLTLVLWAKFLVVESFLYLVVVALPKLAILWIYVRVFPQPVIRKICYGIGAFMLLHMVVVCIVAGTACQPLAYFWDKSLDGWCVDIKELYQWASFPNIISDVAMLLVPIYPLWKLQLPTHVKVGLFFTFATASLGLIASCLRFAEFGLSSPLEDGTWASVILMIWTIVEPGAYLIAACLPTLRPLLVKARDAGRASMAKASFRSFSLSGSSKRGSSDSNATGISKTTTVAIEPASPEREKYFEKEIELNGRIYKGRQSYL